MAMSYAYSTEQRKQVSRRDAPGVAFSEIPAPAVTGESCDPVTRKNQQCGQGVPYSTGQATGERKKYFTQKYGQHQMQLIRKRLAVEEWLDENLRILYAVGPDDLYDCEIDIDEILDLDNQEEQREFIRNKLSNVRKSKEKINDFINKVLIKADSL